MKALFLSTLILSSIYGGNVNSLDTHMDNSTTDKAGLNKLTPQEKQALQEWINNNHTPNSPSQQVKESASDLSAMLSQNIASGKYIELQNDTIWKIHPEDTATSSGWISPVIINVGANPDSNWPYILTNSVTNSKVRAQKISQIPSFSNPSQQNGPDQLQNPPSEQDQIAPINSPDTGPPPS